MPSARMRVAHQCPEGPTTRGVKGGIPERSLGTSRRGRRVSNMTDSQQETRPMPMSALRLLLTALALRPSPRVDDPPAIETTPIGRRVALGEGATLFVPEGFRAREGGVVDVVLHLHGVAS